MAAPPCGARHGQLTFFEVEMQSRKSVSFASRSTTSTELCTPTMTSDANSAPPTAMATDSNPTANASDSASTGNGFRDSRKNNHSQRGNDKRGKKRTRGGGFGSRKYVLPAPRCELCANANATDQILDLRAPTSASKCTTTAWTSAGE